jgi:hypothetical protein
VGRAWRWTSARSCSSAFTGPSRTRRSAGQWVSWATTVVWLLSAIHTIGAGTDGSTPWLRRIMIGTGVPIHYLLVLRVLSRGERRPAVRRARRLAEEQI